MSIPKLIPFTKEHWTLLYKWAEEDHVKNTWFKEGYLTVEEIASLADPNGYDYPYVIEYENQPIGFLLTTDIAAYRHLCPNPKGVFDEDVEGAFSLDLFIGDAAYHNRGIGTQIVRVVVELLFSQKNARRILIDPSTENQRAIRCYEKAGFKIIGETHDHVGPCVIMELKQYGP